MPFLSVMTRCYKRPGMLAENRQSVKAQSDQDLEQCLIVDNIGVGVLEANRNLWRHRDLATGDYVLVLDDDDRIIDSEFVAKLKAQAGEGPSVMVFRTRYPDGEIKPHAAIWGWRPMRGYLPVCAYVVRNDLWQSNIQRFGWGYDDYGNSPAGDFHFIDAVWQAGGKWVWLYEVLTEVQCVSRGMIGG